VLTTCISSTFFNDIARWQYSVSGVTPQEFAYLPRPGGAYAVNFTFSGVPS
jgi:hypothetical protein